MKSVKSVPRLDLLLGILVQVALLCPWHVGNATPQFARVTANSCVKCHSSVPKLNLTGESFRARGYIFPEFKKEKAKEAKSTVPLAAWLTLRYEDKVEEDVDEFFLPKVEIISGGRIRDTPLSYFLEWRLVSESLNSDGSQRSRSGRFEDLFLQWHVNEKWAVKVGQFRALNQVDVSLRLSPSEPALFSSSLPGDPTSDARIQGLRSFSPSGRSPSIAFQFQPIQGTKAAEGLFLGATLPFPGEFSIPLNNEAEATASFEVEGRLKGVFLEGYYKKGMSSLGGHVFLDDDRWLATALAVYNAGDWYLTGGVGTDDTESREARTRYSVEVEYVPEWWERIRPALGMRVEGITDTGKGTAYIPYFSISGPNLRYTFFLQLQYRLQDDNDLFIIDLSSVF